MIVFLGEWKMELCFFQEYLKRKFKIKNQNIKSNIIREIWWHLVIFWHPGMWKKRYRGWDCCFSSEATFIDLRGKIQSSQHLIKDSHATTYTYLCLTDKDKSTSEGKITSAGKYIDQCCSRYTWDIIPLYATQEIETRFLAWLWETFKKEYSWVKDKQLSDFFRKNNNIEDKKDTKEILNEILNQTALKSSTEFIGRAFWLYIDEDMASKRSPSFKHFKETLEGLFWG